MFPQFLSFPWQPTKKFNFSAANEATPQAEVEKKMIFDTTQMPSTKVIVSAAASSVAAGAMLIRRIARNYLPDELRSYVFLKIKDFVASFSAELTLIIEQYDDGLNRNKLFKAAKLYLESRIPPYAKRLKINMPRKETKISLSVEKNEEIVDFFNGVHLKWKFVSKHDSPSPKVIGHHPEFMNTSVKNEAEYFELSFHRKHKDMILNTYLPYVLEKSKEINKEKKTLKLHTLRYDRMSGRRSDVWQSVNLDHPATFDTLAMELDLKKMIMKDLELFLKRKKFYRRVGKAWKRGYLLFGPPGTGKSSLIAAMANYLKFDIYDLELNEIRGNSELRKLLVAMENKSILVVEDIDCSLEIQKKRAEARAFSSINSNMPRPGLFVTENQFHMTLSGLLNFVDGLWSSIGGERIIVFITNHKEKLDPALLRPGRMDLHIPMSYCTPFGFKMLASNYLGITEHPLFLDIEPLIEITNVTPAEIGEQLMKDEMPENALGGLLEFLENKKRDSDESKASEAEVVAVEAEPVQNPEGNHDTLI